MPNFGEDQNIIDAKKNINNAEKAIGHEFKAKLDGEGSYSLIQTDSDLNLESDPICSSAGCTQYKHVKKDLGYKINYPVPNFGGDHDIVDNHSSLDWAERSLNHIWQWKKKAPGADPVLYNDGGPMDPELVDSFKHLRDQE